MTAKHTTRPELINAAERRAFVLEQRKGGMTYREIAAATIKKFESDNLPKNYDERYAYDDVATELKRLREHNSEAAQEIRDIELARLDRMQTAIWNQVLNGNQGAIDRVIRIMQRRADLLGLDAPKGVDLTSKGEKIERVDDERFDRAISSLADAIRESISGAGPEQDGEMGSTE